MYSRHVGDLGNIEVCPDGVARVKTRDSLVEMDGQYSVIGRSVVVSAWITNSFTTNAHICLNVTTDCSFGHTSSKIFSYEIKI